MSLSLCAKAWHVDLSMRCEEDSHAGQGLRRLLGVNSQGCSIWCC